MCEIRYTFVPSKSNNMKLTESKMKVEVKGNFSHFQTKNGKKTNKVISCIDGYVNNWEDCFVYLEIVDGNLFCYPMSKSWEEFYDDYNWKKHFNDHLEYIVRETNEFNNLLKVGGTLFNSYFDPILNGKKTKGYFPILMDTNINNESPKEEEISGENLGIDDVVNKLYELYSDKETISQIKSLDDNSVFKLENLFSYYNVKDMSEFLNRLVNSESLLEKVNMILILIDFCDLNDIKYEMSKCDRIVDIFRILSNLNEMKEYEMNNQPNKYIDSKNILINKVKEYYKI